MELSGKQRAFLRSMCNTLPTILLVGKDGVTDNVVMQADTALEAREIIKCAVQREAPVTAREACDLICEKADAAPVQCIGNRFCMYRPKKENPVIVLP